MSSSFNGGAAQASAAGSGGSGGGQPAGKSSEGRKGAKKPGPKGTAPPSATAAAGDRRQVSDPPKPVSLSREAAAQKAAKLLSSADSFTMGS